MKILVLGGSGFLGSHVSDILTKRGNEVRIFDTKKSIWIKKKQKMYVGNILNLKSLERAIKGCKIVYNFAALSNIDYAKYKPAETIKINVLGTLNALILCKKHNVKKFIQASSIYASSEEGGFYARSKKAAEDYIEEFKNIYGLKFTILRFGSIYGERADNNNAIRNIVYNAIKKRQLIYKGKRDASRRYINAIDVAKACVKVIDKRYDNKYITITGNKNIKISKIFNILSKRFGIPKKRMKYLNEKYTGHYNRKPTVFKPRVGQNFMLGKQKDFKDRLFQLINEIKIKK